MDSVQKHNNCRDLLENRVLRRIFAPNRDKIIGDWRKLRNKEVHTCAMGQILP
jgi:type IV pilus biogenesis protein CpaD/CtpE